MNQPPDPNQQNPQPTVYPPDNVSPIGSAPQQPPYGDNTFYAQPGATPYPPGYNQPGNYPPPGYPLQQPPPTGYLPQGYPAGYPLQQPLPGGYPPPVGMPQRKKTGWIIGGISVALVLIIIIIAAAIITHGFRPEPSSSWLYHSTTSKSLDYVHWTNQNGNLTGSWDEYTSSGQSISFDTDGTYNYQDQSITLNIHYMGISFAIKGNIQGNTMTLHPPTSLGSNLSSSSDLIFHSASQQDYDNAKQNLNSTSN